MCRQRGTVSGMAGRTLDGEVTLSAVPPRPPRRRLTAKDHHIQNALERFVPAHLQLLAERAGVASDDTAAEQLRAVDDLLALNGHSWDSIASDPRHALYRANVLDAAPGIIGRLRHTFPSSTFAFRFVGREGRLERRKGDFEVTITGPTVTTRSVSLKNYAKDPSRIQVNSGTFQSFALAFILESVGIGRWRDPVDASEKRSSARGFVEWRDAALRRNGYAGLVAEFTALDQLHASMRARLIDSEEFRVLNAAEFDQERARVGTSGAATLYRILTALPRDGVKARVLKNIGFDGDEDVLVMGGGLIADTITDPKFAALVRQVRESDLDVTVTAQHLTLSFVDPERNVVLSIGVPCTINSNGAWFRDGDPYEGTRFHAKESCELAWGERRPKKSREIATSINTYVDLGSTGVFRSAVPAPEATIGEGAFADVTTGVAV